MKPADFSKHCLVLFLTLISFAAQASDFAKEKRWADQTVDLIMTGEALWLKADGHKFLGIYTKSATGKTMGGAIIVHGVGVHLNWTEVVQPLRTRLPESGWDTISIQMPILRNEADFNEYAPLFPEIAPRMNAAVDFLKKNGIKNIVVLGHSMGATMAGYYVANTKNSGVRALVAIGATGLMFKDPEQDFIQSLKKIKLPVLDISGSEDLPEVLKTEKLKAKTAKEAGNKLYQQIKIQGANHFLVGKEDELIKEVGNWLKKYQ